MLSYVQSRYWNVGFLNYWTWRQIPNFLLALPVLCLSLRSAYVYFNSMPARRLYDLFGILTSMKDNNQSSFKNNSALYPFAVHLCFLVISGLFFMHVQVKKNQFFLLDLNFLIFSCLLRCQHALFSRRIH